MRQYKTAYDQARQDKTIQYEINQDKAIQNKTICGNTREYDTI